MFYYKPDENAAFLANPALQVVDPAQPTLQCFVHQETRKFLIV